MEFIMKLKLSKLISLLVFVIGGGICQCPASGVTLCDYEPEGRSIQDKNEIFIFRPETVKKIVQESRDETLQFDPVPSKMLKVDAPSDGDKKDDLSVDELCESNAKITMLADKICSLDLEADETVKFVLLEIQKFWEYYNAKLKTTQIFMRGNQDLIDCLCLVTGIIDEETSIDDKSLLDSYALLFKEITGFAMTKENAKEILEKSEGEIACNFRESGGFDEF